jgi:hypothetical protein
MIYSFYLAGLELVPLFWSLARSHGISQSLYGQDWSSYPMLMYLCVLWVRHPPNPRIALCLAIIWIQNLLLLHQLVQVFPGAVRRTWSNLKLFRSQRIKWHLKQQRFVILFLRAM